MSRSPFLPRSRSMALVAALFSAACMVEYAESEPRGEPPVLTPAAPDAAVNDSMAMAGDAEGMPRSVTISAPTDGATVNGPDVTVRLGVAGMEIRPAGDMTDGTGHHHIFMDADLSPAGTPVPTVPNQIIHLGDGSAEYTFTGLAAGEHRVIAVVADGIHVPLQPWVVDTVTFVVH